MKKNRLRGIGLGLAVVFLCGSLPPTAEARASRDQARVEPDAVLGAANSRAVLQYGDNGTTVAELQSMLNRIGQEYSEIPELEVDGVFGPATEDAVLIFQEKFGLVADGVVGSKTWAKLDSVYAEVTASSGKKPDDGGSHTGNGHHIAYPELLEKFDFPNDWSREALEFAVGNRIINGKDSGLAPGDQTTRAETAVILVRLLGAQDLTTELTGYTDVKKKDWFYSELGAAVRIGLMNGTSETRLSPNDRINREQVCVLLSRAFGIYAVDGNYCDRFKDSGQISDFARDAVSALAERGYLNGRGDGTVAPKAYITRAELSKLIYEMVTHICDDPSELPESGNVLYRGSRDIPDGYRLDGNLTLGCGYRDARFLWDVEVSGRLTVRTAPDTQLGLIGCVMDSLCVPSTVKLYSDTMVTRLYSSGKGSVLSLSAMEAYIYADCVLTGDCDEVYCLGDGTQVTANGYFGLLSVSADGVQATVNGNASTCQITGKKAVLGGSGRASNLEIHAEDCKVEISYDTLTDYVAIREYNNALSTVKTVEDWYSFKREEPYSQATMEGFVDQMGYSSNTKWLIWASTKTLTVNVFNGSKGDWSLVRSMPCAMGRASEPTITGQFAVCYKDDVWDFDSYNCRWVTHFYGGYAFHSRPWSPDYSYLVDDSMSTLVSAGCIRMLDDDCYYLYKNVPVDSRVVVY